jgi:TetR/AcrR family transcriptional regulator
MAVKDTGTEKLIKDTAKRIFFSEGNLHATTQDIADAAGVNRTLVHYYFRSRDLLFEQVVKNAKEDLKASLDPVFKEKVDFKLKLQKVISVFMDEIIAYPFRELFVITETKRNKDTIEHAYNDFAKPFLKEIKEEMELGNLKTTDPKQFVMSLFSLMAYPVLAATLNKNILKIKDAEFLKMMKERKQIIFDLLYIGT